MPERIVWSSGVTPAAVIRTSTFPVCDRWFWKIDELQPFITTKFFRSHCTHIISFLIASGIHSAINGKIRPGNVGGLRTGDERHQRGDLFNMPIAVERCGGLLRYRPIARRGIQIRVDRTRLRRC